MAHDLPLILAGPIVRAARTDAIWIWLSTTSSLSIEATLFSKNRRGSDLLVKGRGKTDSMLQLSKACFVQLIRIESTESVIEPGLHWYNLALSGDGRESEKLKWGLESHVPIKSIVPASSSICLPCLSVETQSQVLFSSCRKDSDEGQDAFTYLNLDEAGTDRWPYSSNLMIGDQIYADEVSPWLWRSVCRLSQLLAGDEYIPHWRGQKIRASWRSLDPATRAKVLSEAGLSSEFLNVHCVSLGEFLALYSAVFASRQLEEFLFGSATEVGTQPPARTRQEASLIEVERLALRRWREGLAALRVVLANTPTYFALDDHEVTDDWNIDGSWSRTATPEGSCREAVRDHFLVPNALTAYFAFQGWGNEPDSHQWRESRLLSLQQSLHRYWADPSATPPVETLGWHWDYSTRTRPPFFILDTRTRRSFSAVNLARREYSMRTLHRKDSEPVVEWAWRPIDGLTSTVLVDDRGVAIVGSAMHLQAKDNRCIVVSPCVVFGADFISNARALAFNLLQPFGLTDQNDARIDWDVEEWGSYPASLMQICQVMKLAGPKEFVFVSGDIHCAFVANGSVKYGGSTFNVTQAVSSGSRNQKNARRRSFGIERLLDPVTFQAFWFAPGVVEEVNSKRAFEELGRKGNPTIEVSLKKERLGDGYVVSRNNIGILSLSEAGVSIRIASGPV